MTILFTLAIWGTLSMVIIVLTRRHIKIGIKLWLYKKMGKEPLIIRYHGANKHVRELVIATKGLHETVEVIGKKFFIFKDENGETFFLDQAAMRKRDDDVNEISYNFNSVMAADMSESEDMALKNKEKWLIDMQRFQEEHTIQGYSPVNTEELVKYTDPKRLNEFIKLTYLVAKAAALRDAASWEKWVKIGVAASAAAAIIGIVVWYNLDGKVIPMLQQMMSSVDILSSGIGRAVNATMTVTP
jgi:hypothetical protein